MNRRAHTFVRSEGAFLKPLRRQPAATHPTRYARSKAARVIADIGTGQPERPAPPLLSEYAE